MARETLGTMKKHKNTPLVFRGIMYQNMFQLSLMNSWNEILRGTMYRLDDLQPTDAEIISHIVIQGLKDE
jgi:hypothetical protein